MIAKQLVATTSISKIEWLKWRKSGIGGSDIGAIVGISKYKSPIGVYLEKTGSAPDAKIESEAAYWGTVMEDVIAQEFVKRTEMKVRRRNAILQHPEYEWALANVDRIIIDKERGNGILEIKTASEYLKKEWESDEIPEQYIVQIQWYFFVTGLQWGYFAALVGGNKFVIKEIERDDELIGYLADIAKDFWLNNVEKHEPPMFDGSDASTELLKHLYPESITNSFVSLGKQEELLIEARDQVDREIKVLQEQKAEYENKIKAKLGTSEAGGTENYKVFWKSYITNRFDSKRFKADHPDLYEQYVKESKSRKFTVK
ncbi:YqaJ viral recombinase family protein [Bacillus albus]|uniref:YqaJ viral recombinase family nuclease n=1 Tax=Bacillus albus TaxID=2026189 RepID=UPI0030144D87